jgi:hypothetical protein
VDELDDKIEAFMKENWRRSYTYNEVAKGVGFAISAENARMFRDRMDKLVASATSKIVVARLTKVSKSATKRSRLYQWSLPRTEYDAIRDPHKRDRYVQWVIKDYIKSHPYATTRDITSNVRAAFCHLAAEIVSRNLLALVQRGDVITETGPRRALLHRLKPASPLKDAPILA